MKGKKEKNRKKRRGKDLIGLVFGVYFLSMTMYLFGIFRGEFMLFPVLLN